MNKKERNLHTSSLKPFFILEHSPRTALAVVVPVVVGSHLEMAAEELTSSVSRLVMENQMKSMASADHDGPASRIVQSVVASGDCRLTFG